MRHVYSEFGVMKYIYRNIEPCIRSKISGANRFKTVHRIRNNNILKTTIEQIRLACLIVI